MQQLNPLRVSCPTCKQPEGWACGYVPVGTAHFNRIVAAVQDDFEEVKSQPAQAGWMAGVELSQ